MYTWSVGSRHAPFEFSGHACGAARDRPQAMRRILASASGYSVFGSRGFAFIQRDIGKGLVGNPRESVLKEVRRVLRERRNRVRQRHS